MRVITVVLALAGLTPSQAQKNIHGLINAEKSFAAYSVKHGTRAAFLHFADSNAVVFEKGEAVNALQAWAKKENSTGVLNWKPLFAEIAGSGDLGYNTGPWTFENAGSDSILARGQFITVWHLDKHGDWKFLVDVGTGNAPEPPVDSLHIITAAQKPGDKHAVNVLSAEQAFIGTFVKNKALAYDQFLSKNSILQRNSRLPATTSASYTKVIEETPDDLQFTVTGSGTAPDGSLAYVYGNTQHKEQRENFLHIWRHEKRGWRLALEVLRYR